MNAKLGSLSTMWELQRLVAHGSLGRGRLVALPGLCARLFAWLLVDNGVRNDLGEGGDVTVFWARRRDAGTTSGRHSPCADEESAVALSELLRPLPVDPPRIAVKKWGHG